MSAVASRRVAPRGGRPRSGHLGWAVTVPESQHTTRADQLVEQTRFFAWACCWLSAWRNCRGAQGTRRRASERASGRARPERARVVALLVNDDGCCGGGVVVTRVSSQQSHVGWLAGCQFQSTSCTAEYERNARGRCASGNFALALLAVDRMRLVERT